MTFCFFGNYLPDYSRNAVLIKGLLANGHRVLTCQTRERGFKKYLSLYRQHRLMKDQYDYLLVAFCGFSLVWFAKIISRRPIIFDAFVSQYLSNVEDRKNVRTYSPKAIYYYFIDKIACLLADYVLLDTQEQINYFIKKYHLPSKKFFRVLIGVDPAAYYPQEIERQESDKDKFIVQWHGFVVPFHGVNNIIKAAEILLPYSDIKFRIIARHDQALLSLKAEADNWGLTNIEFIPKLNSTELAEKVNTSDICLGVFALNPKAAVVIPNKVYEAAACKKPSISAAYPAMAEVFSDGQDIILCRPDDPNDLAEKILFAFKNKDWLRNIGEKAYQKYQEKLRPEIIVAQLLKQL